MGEVINQIIGLLRLMVVLIAVIVVVQTVFRKNETYNDPIGAFIQATQSTIVSKDQTRHR